MTSTAVNTSRNRLFTQSSQLRWAAGGWAFFIAENAILSENRTYIIQQVFNGDEEKYHGVYGFFSTVATASIGYAYYKLSMRPPGPLAHLVKTPPTTVPALFTSWCLISLGAVLASQALPKLQIPLTLGSATDSSANDNQNSKQFDLAPSPQQEAPPSWKLQVRCPFDFNHDQKDPSTAQSVHGLDRITRHPGLWSIGCIGLGQSLIVSATSPLPLRVWWMGPAAVAWLGGMHHDSRMRRNIGGKLDPLYDSQTSNFPFAALLTGRQGAIGDTLSALAGEIKYLNAAIAVAGATVYITSRGRVRV